MSTIKSFDEALDFYPPTPAKPALARLGGAMRIYWSAMREGLAAARAYHALTGRGVPHDTAVRRIFTDHFDAR
jgi:hypothetical protein